MTTVEWVEWLEETKAQASGSIGIEAALVPCAAAYRHVSASLGWSTHSMLTDPALSVDDGRVQLDGTTALLGLGEMQVRITVSPDGRLSVDARRPTAPIPSFAWLTWNEAVLQITAAAHGVISSSMSGVFLRTEVGVPTSVVGEFIPLNEDEKAVWRMKAKSIPRGLRLGTLLAGSGEDVFEDLAEDLEELLAAQLSDLQIEIPVAGAAAPSIAVALAKGWPLIPEMLTLREPRLTLMGKSGENGAGIAVGGTVEIVKGNVTRNFAVRGSLLSTDFGLGIAVAVRCEPALTLSDLGEFFLGAGVIENLLSVPGELPRRLLTSSTSLLALSIVGRGEMLAFSWQGQFLGFDGSLRVEVLPGADGRLLRFNLSTAAQPVDLPELIVNRLGIGIANVQPLLPRLALGLERVTFHQDESTFSFVGKAGGPGWSSPAGFDLCWKDGYVLRGYVGAPGHAPVSLANLLATLPISILELLPPFLVQKLSDVLGRIGVSFSSLMVAGSDAGLGLLEFRSSGQIGQVNLDLGVVASATSLHAKLSCSGAQLAMRELAPYFGESIDAAMLPNVRVGLTAIELNVDDDGVRAVLAGECMLGTGTATFSLQGSIGARGARLELEYSGDPDRPPTLQDVISSFIPSAEMWLPRGARAAISEVSLVLDSEQREISGRAGCFLEMFGGRVVAGAEFAIRNGVIDEGLMFSGALYDAGGLSLGKLVQSLGWDAGLPEGLEGADATLERLGLEIYPLRGDFKLQCAARGQFPVAGLSLSTLALECGRTGAKWTFNLRAMGAFRLSPDVALDDIALEFTYGQRGWTATAAATPQLSFPGLPKTLPMLSGTLELGETRKLAIAATVPDGPKSLLALQGVFDLQIKDFSLAIEAPPGKPANVALSCDGCFSVDNALNPGVPLFVVNGRTAFSRSGDVVELTLKPSGKGNDFLKVGPVPLFSVPVAGQPPVEPKFEASLESFVFRKEGAQWSVSAKGSSGLSGLPAPLDRLLPTKLGATAKIGSAGVAFSLTLDKPFAFKVPPLDFGRGPLELGTFAVLISELTVDLTKLSVSGEFGLGIPSELNRRLGAEIFRVYDPKHRIESCVRFRLGIHARGEDGKPGIAFGMVNSPFKTGDAKSGEIEWKSPLGAVAFELPKLRVDFATGEFSASGAFRVTDPDGLQIDTGFLRRALQARGLDDVAAAIPAKIPLKTIDPVAMGLFDPLDRLLQSIGARTIREFKKELPARLNQYLDIKIPTGLRFAIDVTPDGGVALRVEMPKDSPIRMLVTQQDGLYGITLSKLAFGEILGGTFLLLELSAEIDRFDFANLAYVLAMASGAVPASKPAWLPDSKALAQTVYIEDLFMPIFYSLAVPIPIPLFYTRMAVESTTCLGLDAKASVAFPKPEIRIDALLPLAGHLRTFFTDAQTELDSARLEAALPIKCGIGPTFIRLPKYVGDVQIGLMNGLRPTGAWKAFAGIANAIKQKSILPLITAIPREYRMPAAPQSIAFLDVLTIEVDWLLSTPKEFEGIARNERYQRALAKAGLAPAEVAAPLVEGSTAKSEGAAVLLFGEAKVARALTLSTVQTLVATGKGLATGFRFAGGLERVLAIRLSGTVTIDSKKQVKLDGRSEIDLLGRPALKGWIVYRDGYFGIGGEIKVEDPLLSIAGSASGEISDTSFLLRGSLQVKLLGLELAETSTELFAGAVQNQAALMFRTSTVLSGMVTFHAYGSLMQDAQAREKVRGYLRVQAGVAGLAMLYAEGGFDSGDCAMFGNARLDMLDQTGVMKGSVTYRDGALKLTGRVKLEQPLGLPFTMVLADGPHGKGDAALEVSNQRFQLDGYGLVKLFGIDVAEAETHLFAENIGNSSALSFRVQAKLMEILRFNARGSFVDAAGARRGYLQFQTGMEGLVMLHAEGRFESGPVQLSGAVRLDVLDQPGALHGHLGYSESTGAVTLGGNIALREPLGIPLSITGTIIQGTFKAADGMLLHGDCKVGILGIDAISATSTLALRKAGGDAEVAIAANAALFGGAGNVESSFTLVKRDTLVDCKAGVTCRAGSFNLLEVEASGAFDASSKAFAIEGTLALVEGMLSGTASVVHANGATSLSGSLSMKVDGLSMTSSLSGTVDNGVSIAGNAELSVLNGFLQSNVDWKARVVTDKKDETARKLIATLVPATSSDIAAAAWFKGNTSLAGIATATLEVGLAAGPGTLAGGFDFSGTLPSVADVRARGSILMAKNARGNYEVTDLSGKCDAWFLGNHLASGTVHKSSAGQRLDFSGSVQLKLPGLEFPKAEGTGFVDKGRLQIKAEIRPQIGPIQIASASAEIELANNRLTVVIPTPQFLNSGDILKFFGLQNTGLTVVTTQDGSMMLQFAGEFWQPLSGRWETFALDQLSITSDISLAGILLRALRGRTEKRTPPRYTAHAHRGEIRVENNSEVTIYVRRVMHNGNLNDWNRWGLNCMNIAPGAVWSHDVRNEPYWQRIQLSYDRGSTDDLKGVQTTDPGWAIFFHNDFAPQQGHEIVVSNV